MRTPTKWLDWRKGISPLFVIACMTALPPSPAPLHAEVKLPDPLVIAHRGASAIAPENTAAAIREAIRLGAKVIEFDVRTTRDGELVLFHDKELDRVAGRPGTIEESDWTAVRTFDVGKWFAGGRFTGEKILRFDDAIRLFSGLETRGDDAAEAAFCPLDEVAARVGWDETRRIIAAAAAAR